MARLIYLAVSLACLWGAVAAASSTSTPTAAQLLAAALHDAGAAGSVHAHQRVHFEGSTYTISTDAGSDAGVQRLATSGVGNAEIRLVARTAYCRASNARAQLQFCAAGPNESKLDGHWIAYPSTSSSYATIATGLTLASLLRENTPTGELHLTAVRSLGGVRVIGIAGAAPEIDSDATALILWVTDSGEPLPLEADLPGSPPLLVHFSRWGEAIAVSAPKGALDLDSALTR